MLRSYSACTHECLSASPGEQNPFAGKRRERDGAVQLTVGPIRPAYERLFVERNGRLQPGQFLGDLFPFPLALVVDSGCFETAFGSGRRETDGAATQVDERFCCIAQRGGLRGNNRVSNTCPSARSERERHESYDEVNVGASDDGELSVGGGDETGRSRRDCAVLHAHGASEGHLGLGRRERRMIKHSTRLGSRPSGGCNE